MATKVIFLTSGTVWAVPTDWNNASNKIELIGGGGGGGRSSGGGVLGGGGGGGGAYSAIINQTYTPGANRTYAIGGAGAGASANATAGGAGGDTSILQDDNATTAALAKGGKGGLAAGTGGAGGEQAGNTGGVGTTKKLGGNGGTAATTSSGGGAGGGGAAGPNGDGAAGGGTTGTSLQGAGGGGGSNNGAIGGANSGGTGGAGGNGRTGSGGGAANSGNATADLGGGGGGSNSGANVGGNGAQDTIWTQTSDSTTAGPSGGGGGGGPGSTGGAGGTSTVGYGGGGGGGGQSLTTTGNGGAGRPGIIVITYTPVPSVTSILPTSGPTAGSTAVTITGLNFTGATGVAIGGVACTSVVAVNDTTITAVTGAHAAGVVDVVVTTPAGTGTGVGLYTYVAPPPSGTPPSTDIWLYRGEPRPSDIRMKGFGSADLWLFAGLTVPSDIALIARGVLSTSYANNGGLGDRRREIVVTSDIATSVPDGGTDWLVMINGNLTANSTNARQPSTSNDNGDRNITFDWGVNARILINEVRYYMSGTDTFGSWTLEGSNNGTGWTQLGSAFTFGGVAGANKVAVPNSTAYRYYRLHTTSFQGGGSSGSWLEEVEFKLLDITPQDTRPSYYNRFGFGDRGLSSASPITVTTDATLAGGAVQNVVDGDNSANTNAKGFTFNATQVGVNLRFDFTASVAIDTIHWYQSSAQTHGTWKLQGSPDASIWVDVGSPFTLGGNAGVNTYQMGGNLTAYRYYRIIGAPGSTSAIPVINEVEFRIFSSSAFVITILSGDGSSAGVATATAVGVAVITGDGSSAGVATATAVGAAVMPSTGSCTGTSTVTAVGVALTSVPGDGSSAGVGSASAVGAAVMPSTGSSDGVATATSVGVSIIPGDGLSSARDIWLYPGAPIASDIKLRGSFPGSAGLGTATAVGVAVMPSTGSCVGTSTVAAVGAAVIPGDGLAAGAATVTSVGRTIIPAVGNAAGTSTAVAVGTDANNDGSGAGLAAGVGAAAGVGVAVWAVRGAAAGTSTATALGVIIIPAAGLAQGTSSVSGVGINANANPSEPNSVSIVQLLDRSVTVLLGTGGFILIVPDFMVNLSLPLTSQNVTVPDRSLSVNLSDRSIIVTIL